MVASPPVEPSPSPLASEPAAKPNGLAATAWLALVAGVAGAAIRLDYEDYYRPLGVTLDQVGLGGPRLISLAAVVVLTLVGIMGLTLWLVIMLTSDDHWWSYVVGPVTACLVAFLAIVGISYAPGLLIVIGVPLGLLALLAPWLPRPARWERTGHVAAISVCSVALLLIALAWLDIDRGAPAAALRLAAGEQEGHSLADGLLDVAAEPVCLQPAGPVSLPTPRAVILLGTAGGVHVVLVPGAKAVLLPVGTVIVKAGHYLPGTRRPAC
ncbi:MAG: hypothetical protein ACJ74O_02690 [Frankiaceae bacterium]